MTAKPGVWVETFGSRIVHDDPPMDWRHHGRTRPPVKDDDEGEDERPDECALCHMFGIWRGHVWLCDSCRIALVERFRAGVLDPRRPTKEKEAHDDV